MRTPAFVALLVLSACGAPPTPKVTCVAPTDAGTRHDGDTIDTNTTWTAAGSPHVITYSPQVKVGATLTLEPCAVVQLQAGTGLMVMGRLEALGTAEQPITITAQDAAKPFGFLEVRGGFADLAYVTLSHGGAPGSDSNAMLDVWGDSTPPRAAHARLRHVALAGSELFGLTLERSGALTDDSTDLVITGAKSGPIQVRDSALVQSIPAGAYTGNGVDEIQVVGYAMEQDTTWSDRGVPYRIGDVQGNGADFRVGLGTGGQLVTWTVEAGVKVRVSPSGRILFQQSNQVINGSLVARGTAAKPIVFTSTEAAPVAGQWDGLVFDATPHASTVLDHVELRYAGGPSQANSFHCEPGSAGDYSRDEDAALVVYGQPGSSFLTNSLIADSLGDGVDLAYSGAAVDFLGSNTFTNVRCRVTTPRAPNGSCPNPVPACN